MNTRLLIALISLVVIVSCSIEPEKINYGTDTCHYCQMTIIDGKHTSQMVTKKGKVYKYDSIECLINDTASKDSGSVALLMVADFANPGSLINAKEAMYLVSDSISSPMGANLSAFISLEQLNTLKREMGGTSYTWKEINQVILDKGN